MSRITVDRDVLERVAREVHADHDQFRSHTCERNWVCRELAIMLGTREIRGVNA